MRFITAPTPYHRVRDLLNRCFELEARLPGQVLQRVPQAHAFFEFDEVFSETFWNAMKGLLSHYGDDTVIFSVVEPDPESYFYKEFGYYPAMELSRAVRGDQYLSLFSFVPDDSPADALLHNSQALVFLSQSGGMAIWADRDLELGLLALYDGSGVQAPNILPESVQWFDVHRAIEVISPAFTGGRVPGQVHDELMAHYG